MRSTTRRLALEVPPDAAFAACVELLRTADPARGVVARHCQPDPPRVGSTVVSRMRASDGAERQVRSRVVTFEPPSHLATASDGDGPAVRTSLHVEPRGTGSRVTLLSEVATGLPLWGPAGRGLDALLFARVQRRAARATLRRLAELAVSARAGR